MVIGLGISRSARVDQWLCALAASNGGPGEVTFFLRWEDRHGKDDGKLWLRLPRWLRRRADGAYLFPLENKHVRQWQHKLAGQSTTMRSRDDALTAVENQHRDQITALRQQFLQPESPQDEITHIIDQAIDEYLAASPDMRHVGKLLFRLNLGPVPPHWAATAATNWATVLDNVKAAARNAYQHQAERGGRQWMDQVLRAVPLAVLAKLWREHLVELDILMQRCGAATGEPGSLVRYEAAAASRYATMLANFRHLVAQHVLDPETLGPDES